MSCRLSVNADDKRSRRSPSTCARNNNNKKQIIDDKVCDSRLKKSTNVFNMSLRAHSQPKKPTLTSRLRDVLHVGMHRMGHESPLGRQRAVRDIWPPDANENFAYIRHSPADLAAILNARGFEVQLDDGTLEYATPKNVAYYIWSKHYYHRQYYPAYGAWVMRHYDAIYELLHDRGIPLLPRRQSAQILG